MKFEKIGKITAVMASTIMRHDCIDERTIMVPPLLAMMMAFVMPMITTIVKITIHNYDNIDDGNTGHIRMRANTTPMMMMMMMMMTELLLLRVIRI